MEKEKMGPIFTGVVRLHDSGEARGGTFSWLLLVLCVGVTGAFFFSFWGRNAQGLGRDDMGLALGLSFLFPLTIYASFALAFVAILAAFLAWWRGYALRLLLASVVIALIPSATIVLVDLHLLTFP